MSNIKKQNLFKLILSKKKGTITVIAFITFIRVTVYFAALVLLRYAIDNVNNVRQELIYSAYFLISIIVATTMSFMNNYFYLKINSYYQTELKKFLLFCNKKEVPYELFVNGTSHLAKHAENLLRLIFVTISTLIFTILLCTTGRLLFSWFDYRAFYFFLGASILALIFFLVFFLVAIKQNKKTVSCYMHACIADKAIEDMVFDCKNTKKEIIDSIYVAYKHKLGIENSKNVMAKAYEIVILFVVTITYFLGYVIFPQHSVLFSFATIAFLIVYIRRYLNNLKCLLEYTYSYSMNKIYLKECYRLLANKPKGGKND